MSKQEQNDYPEMYRHYAIAIATGSTHHEALIYAQGQIRNLVDINHLIVKP